MLISFQPQRFPCFHFLWPWRISTWAADEGTGAGGEFLQCPTMFGKSGCRQDVWIQGTAALACGTVRMTLRILCHQKTHNSLPLVEMASVTRSGTQEAVWEVCFLRWQPVVTVPGLLGPSSSHFRCNFRSFNTFLKLFVQGVKCAVPFLNKMFSSFHEHFYLKQPVSLSCRVSCGV